MTLREVLERYAILQNLSDRTVVLYSHTLDRFRDCLGHEPTIDDLDDMIVAGFLRWRAVTPHRARWCLRPRSPRTSASWWRWPTLPPKSE